MEGSGEKGFPCPFPLERPPAVLASILKVSTHTPQPLPPPPPPSLTPPPPSFTCKPPGDDTGPTWVIQENSPTQNLSLHHFRKVPLPRKVTHSRASGSWDVDIFGGDSSANMLGLTSGWLSPRILWEMQLIKEIPNKEKKSLSRSSGERRKKLFEAQIYQQVYRESSPSHRG